MLAEVSGEFWGKPYLVRRVGGQLRNAAAEGVMSAEWQVQRGEWRLERQGIPPLLFPATPLDTEVTVREFAERLLARILPEP